MKVVLSIDPVRFPLTGVGRYTFELAKNLRNLPELELCYINGSRILRELPDLDNSASWAIQTKQNLKQQLLKYSPIVDFAQAGKSILLSRSLRRHAADALFHGPNFYLPRFDGPRVATIHDLSIYKWEDCHPPERVRHMRKQIELTMRRADMLITDSEFTRQEVASFFSYPLDKIKAIPLAAGDSFKPRSARETAVVLDRFGLQFDGYCLCSGTIEPRKNIGRLLDAYESLPIAIRSRWPLVLCGFAGWKSELLHERIADLERQGSIRYLGYISDTDLPLLYAGARAFIYPSLYEGFGLPVLEAMAAGVPIVYSDAASIPEVAGNAGIMVNPQDTRALANSIAEILENESSRTKLIQAGLQRASRFSWEHCAANTAQIYQQTAQS